MRVKLLLAVICAVAFSLPAGAHHSHGNYLDTFKDVEGVVTEVHFVVPHSWVYLEVKGDKGEVLRVTLRYTEDRDPVIMGMERVSR